MLRAFFDRIGSTVSELIQRPVKILIVCLTLLAAGLVLDGSLFRLWRLNRDYTELNSRMGDLRRDTQRLDQKIRLAKDPNFIELKAREKFDLASEGDLIFVFSDEN